MNSKLHSHSAFKENQVYALIGLKKNCSHTSVSIFSFLQVIVKTMLRYFNLSFQGEEPGWKMCQGLQRCSVCLFPSPAAVFTA